MSRCGLERWLGRAGWYCHRRVVLPPKQFFTAEFARPRAADDFSIIRAPMQELRRERAQALAEVRDEP